MNDNMKKSVLAVAAHPDDIEFMMAGTLIMLHRAGWQVHYMNIANGSCGTATEDPQFIIRRRRKEARTACEVVDAVFHESLCNDLEVYHTTEIVSRVVSVVRAARPSIVLTSSPRDYMEDHINSSRIAVTATFARGMRNYPCEPHRAPITEDVTVYHALPYGLKGPLRETIRAGQYVNITSVMDKKREMLACHRSQKEWLDKSQGMNAYLDAMFDFSKQVGKMSGEFEFAEGWRRRSHLGFSATEIDPLEDTLEEDCLTDAKYEHGL